MSGEKLASKMAVSERNPFPWHPRTLFAPMEGVTHPILRERMASAGGVGVVCTEFVRVTSNPMGRSILKKHVVRPSKGALSVQVMGNHIEQMAEATTLVTEAGADIVDINLGCPAPRAVRKGVGSAMLRDLPLLGRVLTAMRRRTHLPLSAKIRAGFDEAENVISIARVVQESGADFICVHPRRRVDFYKGVADWRIIARLVDELSIPVVGNGDVWYASDAPRMRKETGCDAVMIGRPALRNPWIFRQIEALEQGVAPIVPCGQDVVEHLRSLACALEEGFTEKSALGMLKEQVRYLSRILLQGRDSFSREALRAACRNQLLDFFDERVGQLRPEDLDLSADGAGVENSGSALVHANLP